MRKPIFALALLVAPFVFGSLRAGQTTEIFDVPTALNPVRGEAYFRFSAYDGGGLGVKGGIGITPFLSLGIVQYFDGLIGANTNGWEIPGIEGKISVLNQPPEGWNFAFGYQPIYNGSFRNGAKHPYGPFAVLTKGFMLFAKQPHLVSVGATYALVPDIGHFTAFASLLVSITSFLNYGVEVTGLTFQKNSDWDFINNHSVTFTVTENLAFQFVFQIASKYSVDPKGNPVFDTRTSRNLRVSVQTYF